MLFSKYRSKILILVLCSMLALSLTACFEYTDEERDKVSDLVHKESGNFKSAANSLYGDAKVTNIRGEKHRKDVSLVLPSVSVVAGDNLYGSIELKNGDSFDAIYIVESGEIHSHRNYNLICDSFAEELARYEINALGVEMLDSASVKPMYNEEITSYKQLVDEGYSMRFKVITDSNLGGYDSSHFSILYDEMILLDENGGYLRVHIAQTSNSSKVNVDELMSYWHLHGMRFSKHESSYVDGYYDNGDENLSEFGVVSTLKLDDSRDGVMEYTDSNDIRIRTFRSPNSNGEYSYEVSLIENN